MKTTLLKAAESASSTIHEFPPLSPAAETGLLDGPFKYVIFIFAAIGFATVIAAIAFGIKKALADRAANPKQPKAPKPPKPPKMKPAKEPRPKPQPAQPQPSPFAPPARQPQPQPQQGTAIVAAQGDKMYRGFDPAGNPILGKQIVEEDGITYIIDRDGYWEEVNPKSIGFALPMKDSRGKRLFTKDKCQLNINGEILSGILAPDCFIVRGTRERIPYSKINPMQLTVIRPERPAQF